MHYRKDLQICIRRYIEMKKAIMIIIGVLIVIIGILVIINGMFY